VEVEVFAVDDHPRVQVAIIVTVELRDREVAALDLVTATGCDDGIAGRSGSALSQGWCHETPVRS
jgi:hypothetical protein